MDGDIKYACKQTQAQKDTFRQQSGYIDKKSSFCRAFQSRHGFNSPLTEALHESLQLFSPWELLDCGFKCAMAWIPILLLFTNLLTEDLLTPAVLATLNTANCLEMCHLNLQPLVTVGKYWGR